MLIPVNYHKRRYPEHIKPHIDEVAGHFDVDGIIVHREFSLHTEYSYAGRNLDSLLLEQLPTIKGSHDNGVPKLWHTDVWAYEFAEFVKSICKDREPSIIEVHPPFSDYTPTIDSFIEKYKIFESSIIDTFPNTMIYIENRSGSIYKGGKFIVSKGRDLRELSEGIAKNSLRLRITLDIPQLITAYGGPGRFDPKGLLQLLNRQNVLRPMVDGLHLWGKKKSASGRTVSHAGDLNSYFDCDSTKNVFLDWFADFLDDGKPRHFVPEVNSSDEDLHSIVADLESKGIVFT